MTFDDRVRALTPLGFSDRQTRFLVTVALHGGFCLRRHYMSFAGLQYGAGVRDFLERLVTRKVAARFDFRRDRGHVYHLHASAIYDAIGQADNRNRRSASAALIARKLMILDYVLGHPGVEWIATEEDKVSLFSTRFGVPLLDLPQRVYVAPRRDAPPTIRYFIHKLPIFVTEHSPIVSFVWLVTDTSGEAFEQFLHDHVRLLSHLTQWRIVAVAPRHIPGLPACAPALERVANGHAAAPDGGMRRAPDVLRKTRPDRAQRARPRQPRRDAALPDDAPTAAQLIADWRGDSEPDPDRLVFSTRSGLPLSPNNVLRRAIFPACARLQLPNATWLTFRRTYSSWSHDKGVPVKVIAQ